MPKKKEKKAKGKKKLTGKAKLSGKRKATRKKRLIREKNPFIEIATPVEPSGMGARSGGQSGDIQGLSGVAIGNSESEEELIEEGQDLEAEKISGVENVPDADEIKVVLREVPEEEGLEKEGEELEVEKAPPEYEEEKFKKPRKRRFAKRAGSK